MIRKLDSWLDSLIDHYTTFCILLALFIMTLLGVGDIRAMSILGFILCVVGLAQRSAQVDPWIFVPLVLYDLVSMASSFAAYGNFTDGYGATHLIFPVLYGLMACLDEDELLLLRRLCAVLTGALAAGGAVWFVCRAVFQGRAERLSGVLGNPNAMGIFLVISWFLLLNCLPEAEETAGCWERLLPRLEPLLFLALALTLSMGSFAAMAVGILVLLIAEKRRSSWRDTFSYTCRILARAVLGVGTGLLIYLGAARTGAAWICLPLLLYALAVVLCWKQFCRFLAVYPRMAAVIAGVGILVAAAAAAVRPGAAATFSERLEMMQSGLRYLTVNPLLGVGPYRWRLLDLYDGGKYFNTWHIHNVPLHVAVEMGWIAAALLLIVVLRFCRKKANAPVRAGFTAFCFHNLMDTSFFYLGITSLVVIAAGAPGQNGKRVNGVRLKVLYGLFAALYVLHFCGSILA